MKPLTQNTVKNNQEESYPELLKKEYFEHRHDHFEFFRGKLYSCST